MNLKTFTYSDIQTWSPCYDPIKFIPKDWSGTALDVCLMESVPFQDVLWCVCREGLIDDGIMRRFAAWCAAEALFVANQTDSRSWNAVEVAVKFSLGQATDDERYAAGAAARYAACAAAGAAAWDAARYAAGAAAWDAAWDYQRKKLISMLKEESDFTLDDLLNNYPIERT
jgi:hypothetical protein